MYRPGLSTPVVAGAIIVAIAGCGEPTVDEPGSPGEAPSLQVTAPSVLEPGTSSNVFATVIRDGRRRNVPADWDVGDLRVLRVNQDLSSVTALTEGETTLAGCWEGLCDTVAIRVGWTRFLRVAAVPPLGVGQRWHVEAAYLDSAGAVRSAALVTLTASGAVANTDTADVVVGVALGAGQVVACDFPRCDTATVVVDVEIALPDTIQLFDTLTPTLQYADGVGDLGPPRWQLDGAGFDLVDSVSGTFRAVWGGTGTLAAEVGGRWPRLAVAVTAVDSALGYAVADSAHLAYDSVLAVAAHPIIAALASALQRFDSLTFSRAGARGHGFRYEPADSLSRYAIDSTMVVPDTVIRYVLFGAGGEVGWVDVSETSPPSAAEVNVTVADSTGVLFRAVALLEAHEHPLLTFSGRIQPAGTSWATWSRHAWEDYYFGHWEAFIPYSFVGGGRTEWEFQMADGSRFVAGDSRGSVGLVNPFDYDTYFTLAVTVWGGAFTFRETSEGIRCSYASEYFVNDAPLPGYRGDFDSCMRTTLRMLGLVLAPGVYVLLYS